MPPHPLQSFDEQKQIIVLDSHGHIVADSASGIACIPNSVRRYLKEPESYGKRKGIGRPRMPNERDQRHNYDTMARDSGTLESIC